MTAMSETDGMTDEDWRLWRAFSSMNRALARELDRQLQRDAGISNADYSVLITLFEANGARLRTGELAELLSWEKSRVSHQISRMEARALVERTECSEDGRGTWITLTADGRRATLGAMRDHAAKLREIFFDVLGEQEKDAIRTGAARVLDKIDPPACRIAAEVFGESSLEPSPAAV
jgi:DNA-binding MarR family transcriptional regulator